MKKIIALILIFVMALSCLPVQGYAAEETSDVGTAVKSGKTGVSTSTYFNRLFDHIMANGTAGSDPNYKNITEKLSPDETGYGYTYTMSADGNTGKIKFHVSSYSKYDDQTSFFLDYSIEDGSVKMPLEMMVIVYKNGILQGLIDEDGYYLDRTTYTPEKTWDFGDTGLTNYFNPMLASSFNLWGMYLVANLDFSFEQLGFRAFGDYGDDVCDMASDFHVGGQEKLNARPAGCVTDGYTGDLCCAGCQTVIETGNTIASAGSHTYDHGCDEDCNVCGETRTTAHVYTSNCDDICDACGAKRDASHDYSAWEKISDTQHKRTCATCGNVETGSHADSAEVRNAVAATCTTAGYSGDTWCKDCGIQLTTGEEIPAGHKLVHKTETAPTHAEPGWLEHWACEGCQKCYTDDTATTEVAAAEVTIAAIGHTFAEAYTSDEENHWKACSCGERSEVAAHTYGAWTTVKNADVGVEGMEERTCTECGYKQTKNIPGTSNPATGDGFQPVFLAVMMLASAAAVLFLLTKANKKNKYQA